MPASVSLAKPNNISSISLNKAKEYGKNADLALKKFTFQFTL